MGQKHLVPVAKLAPPPRASALVAPPPPPPLARPIPASPSGQANVAEDEPTLWERWDLDSLPSWLTSMVVHMTMLLLLALIASGGSGNGGPGNTIGLDLEIGGDSSANVDGELLSAGDISIGQPQPMVAENTTLPSVEMPPLTDFSTVLATAPPMDLVGALHGLGHGAGTGGQGTGSGGETGDGNGRGGSGNGLLGPVTTGIFGLISEGSTFVYVFDRSGSMNSSLKYSSEGTDVFSITPLVAAKAELIKSLRDLGSKQQFHVLFYNHQVLPFNTGRSTLKPIQATTENVKKVEAFVQSVPGFGKTYHFEPMEMALKMRPDVIFLLTDGEEQDDPSDAQLAELSKLNKGYRTKINVIQIGFEPRPGCTLERLAKENRGKHMFLNIANLGPVLKDMVK